MGSGSISRVDGDELVREKRVCTKEGFGIGITGQSQHVAKVEGAYSGARPGSRVNGNEYVCGNVGAKEVLTLSQRKSAPASSNNANTATLHDGIGTPCNTLIIILFITLPPHRTNGSGWIAAMIALVYFFM